MVTYSTGYDFSLQILHLESWPKWWQEDNPVLNIFAWGQFDVLPTAYIYYTTLGWTLPIVVWRLELTSHQLNWCLSHWNICREEMLLQTIYHEHSWTICAKIRPRISGVSPISNVDFGRAVPHVRIAAKSFWIQRFLHSDHPKSSPERVVMSQVKIVENAELFLMIGWCRHV